ncbi:hypothetical protein RND71_038950 [Anisodus tanguticus]|uniref:Myb/SANT-like DNA-binding domain-containing protein n=1 Tax=Anisodus tanguticus TaxID=243964 RepID=A0AAE1UZL7_9SOLA|nr:hypothetical protein RND71_038950 [Anisodus tanguticus]
MEDQYGMADLRQYMNGGRSLFGSIQQVLPELLPATTHQHHRNLGLGHHQYEMVMGMAQVPAHGLPPHHQQHEFLGDSSTTVAAGGTTTAASSGGIMSEEHGYQRTGKKCREKFENLYKYYKKTKEGKAGRQDGKHYRFFRQLEALYGETSYNISASASETHHLGSHFPYNPVNNNNNQDPHNFHHQAPKSSDSLSLSNSSEFNTSSSDDSELNEKSKDKMSKKRRGKRSLKAKIKDFIDGQMRKLMEKQEIWLEKMMKMIEHKEQERILREEEWRNQETIRMEREQNFWANERAWIEARDAALMEAVHKLSGKDLKSSSTNPRPPEEELVECRVLTDQNNRNDNRNEHVKDDVDRNWPESEITRLIQLRTIMESRFQQIGIGDDHVLWEEIGAKMAILGYDKSATMCKNKWGSINSYLIKCNKKRKENSTSSCYNNNVQNINNQYYEADGSSCFRYLMGDADHQNLWENYELKLSKGGGGNN